MVASRNSVYGGYLYTEKKDNADAVITLPSPGSDYFWSITQIEFGYSANPAAPKELTVDVDGTVDLKLPVTNAGSKSFKAYPDPVQGDVGVGMTITLPASGTGGVYGYLVVLCAKIRHAT